MFWIMARHVGTTNQHRTRWQAVLLLFLHPPAPILPTLLSPPPPTSLAAAQRQSALYLHLASDCTLCLTVDSTQGLGEFAPLQTSDCAATPAADKLWLMAQDAADGGGWWCLASNPALCVEEGGTLLLSEESETSPYQQFAYGDELRMEQGSQIVGGGSGDCVTLVTGGGVRMNDCAVGGVGEGIGMTRQRWRAVEEGRPLCSDGETGGDGGGGGGGNGGSTGGGGGGGFLGDETTLPDPSRILLFLENECNQCIGVDDAAPDAPLKLVSCKDTPALLKLWSFDLLVGSSIAQSVCLEFDPSLCIVETDDGGELRLGDGRSTTKSAYILNKFIDDQIESLDEVGNCIAFVGGDGTIALEECSTSKSGQYWTKQGEAYWTEECANTPPPSPRPTAKPTSGPAPPSIMAEEVPWWTILLVVIGSILVGVAVYYLASAYFSSHRRKLDVQRRRRNLSRPAPSRSQPSPGIS